MELIGLQQPGEWYSIFYNTGQNKSYTFKEIKFVCVIIFLTSK